jgi:hypothetical protein
MVAIMEVGMAGYIITAFIIAICLVLIGFE